MRDLALEIAGLAAGKKAEDIVVLEMADAVTYTDYFVIATGANARLTTAIADESEAPAQRLRRRASKAA